MVNDAAQGINQLVTDEAFKQLDQLENKLVLSKKTFVDTAKAAKMFTDAIGGAKNLRDYSNAVDKAVKGNQALGESSEKVRLAEIRLEMARRKSFDDYNKRLAKQAAAEQKAEQQSQARNERAIRDQEKQSKADILARNARIKNIDDYNKRLAKQAAAEQKAAKAAEIANTLYNRLNVELGVLRTRARDIGVEFGTNSKQFKEAAASVNVLDKRLRDINHRLGQDQVNVGNYTSALKGLSRELVGMAAQYLSVYAVIGGGKRLIQNNAEISDSLADVARTASLTADEADKLVEQLKKIDTRTSLKGLLAIATIGGQLGISKDQLAGFTKVVDELSVVLANEIPGGAEAVATSLGKINGVFKVQQQEGTNTEQSLRKTGSAILALGQAGLATGEFLQDFTLRTAGVAQTAKISLPTILAYSAVLEETGSTAEVAGTAFNKLVGALSSKREQFFKIAQIGDATLTLKDFTNLINTDANSALQKFFVGLNKGGSSLTTFTDLLDTLKIKGGPGKNAIIALAQNQELLNTRIAESVDAYQDGTLAAEQFAIKNNNLAGSLEKLGNTITNITTNPNSNLGRWFKGLIDSLTGGLKGIDVAIDTLRNKQYDSAIKVFDRSGGQDTGNIFISTEDVKRVKSERDSLAIQEKKNNAQKVGLQLAHDIVLDNKVTGETVKSLAREETKLAEIRASYIKEQAKGSKKNIDDLNSIALKLITQKTIVQQLRNIYSATAKPTPVDISGVVGGGKAKSSKTNNPITDGIISQQKSVAGIRDAAKSTVDDDKADYQSRLNALEVFTNESEEFARLDGQKQLQNAKLTADGRVAIFKDVQNKIDEIRRESVKKQLDIVTSQLSAEDQLRVKANQKELTEINEQESFKLSQLKQAYANGTISLEQYEKLQLDIQNEYAIKRISAQIDQTKKLLEVLTLTDDQRASAEKTLRDLTIKYTDEVNDYKLKSSQTAADAQKKLEEKILDEKKQIKEKEKELARELLNFTGALISASFTNQLNAIQEQIDLNEKRKAQDIEDVNNSVATEEEKADKIAIINARAASEQELLEQKQREIKVRQAKADKAAAISGIIINIALAQTKTLGQLGFLGLPLNAIIAGIGALQIATVLATPIPAFEHGGTMRENGLAMYGEAGSELRIDPEGKLSITPDKPTVGYVQAGTQFVSNRDLVRMMNMPEPIVNIKGKELDLTPLISSQEKGFNKLSKTFKAQKSAPQMSKRALYEANNQSIQILEWKSKNLS